MSDKHQLLPEWVPQEAVILAWPDEKTDWAPWLQDVTQTYLSLIESINQAGAGVLLLVRPLLIDQVKSLLPENAKVLLIAADYNDTWVRDYGFLTCTSANGNIPIEFEFNGWGKKFDAAKDNQINKDVLFPLCRQPAQSYAYVVEGGALEIDDKGQLMSTEFCLTNPQRNGDMSLDVYSDMFTQCLGAQITQFFKHGHLEGDDTDGHVDTLARYTPDQGIVIQSSFNRSDDPHFAGLSLLVQECKNAFPDHSIHQLPLPDIVNENGERLPASYANYLICNQNLLCPIYQQPEDAEALAVLEKAHPGFNIVPINALPLIQQFGSVHCISMQVPEGTLKPHVVEQLLAGVSVYEQK